VTPLRQQRSKLIGSPRRLLRHSSNHPEPLHQDRIARCDRSNEAVLRSLAVLRLCSRWAR